MFKNYGDVCFHFTPSTRVQLVDIGGSNLFLLVNKNLNPHRLVSFNSALFRPNRCQPKRNCHRVDRWDWKHEVVKARLLRPSYLETVSTWYLASSRSNIWLAATTTLDSELSLTIFVTSVDVLPPEFTVRVTFLTYPKREQVWDGKDVVENKLFGNMTS